MNNKVILDASALLALIQEEPGSNVIKPLLQFAVMSTVNISEVLAVLQKTNITTEESLTLITDIINTIIPFDIEQAEETAKLQFFTTSKGLSLGDRACIALGIKLQSPIYTADKAWIELQLPNVTIQLIR